MNDIQSVFAAATGGKSNKPPNDAVEAVLSESAILPAQFYPSRRTIAEMEPVRRLAFAILADAVRSIQVNLKTQTRSKMRDFAEAKRWLFETMHDGPFSFENVCYLLELHPADVREALRKWQAMNGVGALPAARLRRSPVNRRKALHQSHIIRRTG